MRMLVKLALSGRCCVEFIDESFCRIQDSIFIYMFLLFFSILLSAFNPIILLIM